MSKNAIQLLLPSFSFNVTWQKLHRKQPRWNCSTSVVETEFEGSSTLRLSIPSLVLSVSWTFARFFSLLISSLLNWSLLTTRPISPFLQKWIYSVKILSFSTFSKWAQSAKESIITWTLGCIHNSEEPTKWKKMHKKRLENGKYSRWPIKQAFFLFLWDDPAFFNFYFARQATRARYFYSKCLRNNDLNYSTVSTSLFRKSRKVFSAVELARSEIEESCRNDTETIFLTSCPWDKE